MRHDEAETIAQLANETLEFVKRPKPAQRLTVSSRATLEPTANCKLCQPTSLT